MAMAIARRCRAGAKVVAMTVLVLVTTPKIVADAKLLQEDVQFKEQTYDPVLTATDVPALHLNEELNGPAAAADGTFRARVDKARRTS